MREFRFEETKYGFNYGAADIERVHSDAKKGWVILAVKTPRAELQIYITKTGKVRVYDQKKGKELSAPKESVSQLGAKDESA